LHVGITKIYTEQFRVASEDSTCIHILYAACHDSSYLSQLVPFSGVRDKVTLVQGAGWNPEFHSFNLNVTQFPTVFRWLDLPTAVHSTKPTHANGAASTKPKVAQQKITQNLPCETHRQSSFASGQISSRSSVPNGDRASSVSRNGFDTDNGTDFGSKTTSSLKPSKDSAQQPCRFFQKVIQYDTCRFSDNG
jgi:hypothetical protein